MEKISPKLIKNIFKYTNYNKINKNAENKINVKELNIDLLKINSNTLSKFNPIILNITCSQLNNIDKNLNDDQFYKKIEIINKNLEIIKKFKNLTTINIRLDFLYTIKDINIPHNEKYYNNFFSNIKVKEKNFIINENNFFVEILIKILKLNVTNIYIKIKKYDCCINDRRIFIQYEHYVRRFLMENAHYFNKFIFNGNDGHYFIYDKILKILIFNVGDYRKYDLLIADEYIFDFLENTSIKTRRKYNNNNLLLMHKYDNAFSRIDLNILKNMNLNTFHIYNVYFDTTFWELDSEKKIRKFNIKNLKYFYFIKKDEISKKAHKSSTNSEELIINEKYKESLPPYEIKLIKDKGNNEYYNLKNIISRIYK